MSSGGEPGSYRPATIGSAQPPADQRQRTRVEYGSPVLVWVSGPPLSTVRGRADVRVPFIRQYHSVWQQAPVYPHREAESLEYHPVFLLVIQD
jgi:hypothetical protein